MKTNHIYYSLLLLLAFLLPTSCSHEEDIIDIQASNNDKVSFTIGVSVPGATNVASRAFGNETYNFENLYVAVFEVTPDGSYFKEFVPGTPAEGTDNDGCQEFNVQLTKAQAEEGSEFRLHIIANYPNLTMGFGEEGQLIGRLETLSQEDGHDVYWNFVELTTIDDSSVSALQHVPLVRNYAKVQLEFADNLNESFEFVAYALYNVPTKGTVAAYNTSVEGNFTDFNGKDYDALTTAGYIGNEAYNDGSLYTNVWMENGSTAPYYMYERKNTGVDNPTCMIIKGKFDGVETYYKLDFINSDGEYYNLLRNFVYTMNVTEIKGAGYDTEEEALRQPACNNISGDAVAQDFTNVSDGTSQLFVTSTFVLFTQQKTVDLYYKYIPDISTSTTSNGTVTIEGTTGNVLASSTIATADEGTNSQYAGWRKVTLNSNTPSAAATTQELVFKAGGLQRKVTLMLNQPYQGMTVSAYDKNEGDEFVAMEAKKEVQVDITLPAGIPESLFPLRLFISSQDNTIYPDYGTNMPAEVQNGKYGFIKEVSYSDAYNEDKSPKTIACDFLTNCADNASTVYVENEYLARGSDQFKNDWKDEVTLNAAITVSIEQIWGRYPQTIYGSGNNNGTESVTVTLNGQNKGTITINSSQVVNGSSLMIQDSEGLSKNDVVVFTFTDNYWHGQWSSTPITWQAEATLGALDSGTTLNFVAVGEIAKISSIEIGTTQAVSVSRDNNRYPQNIYNSGSNNGTETVTITLNNSDTSIGTITIDRDNVREGTTLNIEGGFSSDDVLTFTFEDKYYGSSGWQRTWIGPVDYTATCTVGDLLSGSATLNFTH